MSESLKSKAINGILWSIIDKIAVRGVGFIVSVIIARILSPSDYGLIGMVAIFMALANMLIESGFSQALVQKQDRSQIDFSTVFFFNIAVGLICYLIIFLTAPFVAEFYSTPIITNILRILGIGVIINSFCTVQRANLLIKIDFKTIAKINLLSTLVSAFIGISMAYLEYGVWALVAQTIAQQLFSTILLWIFGRWVPTLQFSRQSFKKLFGFGSKLLAAGTIATAVKEVYSVVIGRFYNVSELGFYTRAVQTTDLVAITLNDAVNSVTFPLLSSIQDDKERMIAVCSKMIGMTAFVIFPIMTLLAVVANPFILVLFTDKWLPAVYLLQWLCFSRLFYPLSVINLNILNAAGRSDMFLKLDISKIPVVIIVMFITIPKGINAIVIGSVISSFIGYLMNTYVIGKMFNFGVVAQFKIFWKIILATLLMAILTTILISFIDNSLIKLIAGACFGALSYYLCVKLLKVDQITEIEKIIKSFVSK